MSFKNYKINNFFENQILSYQDLNNLAINDTILYNKIRVMPRGVIGFSEIRQNHDNNNSFLASSFPSDTDNESQRFKMIQNAGVISTDFTLSFFVENFRLIKISFYAAYFEDSRVGETYTNPGNFKAGFFVSENGGEYYLANATYKTSSLVKSTPALSSIPQGSISMHYITTLPSGTHSVKVGITSVKSDIIIGKNALTRPTQIYVEDLGEFIASGSTEEASFDEALDL